MWVATALLDKLGLYTTEAYQKGREEVIMRQQQEMLELSTPVVKLWDWNSGPAPDRHARQRAHAGGDGVCCRSIVESGARHRHHRHHRRAHGGHPGRAAPAQDGGGRPLDGGRLHHQRHPPADRADHRSSGRGPPRVPPRPPADAFALAREARVTFRLSRPRGS